jgi:hypothetical protein
VVVSHRALALELVVAEVLRREQLELHQVRPLKLLSVRQVEELFQQTQEDALTHQERMAVAVKAALVISFAQE